MADFEAHDTLPVLGKLRGCAVVFLDSAVRSLLFDDASLDDDGFIRRGISKDAL
jgi:hypothetical protein